MRGPAARTAASEVTTEMEETTTTEDKLSLGLDALGAMGLGDWLGGAASACTDHRELGAVWDGDESAGPEMIDAARQVCNECPVLGLCQRRAELNPYEPSFLAAQTASERRAALSAAARIAWRRRAVGLLYDLGLAVEEICAVVSIWMNGEGQGRGLSRRTVEQDISWLGLSGRRRRNHRAAAAA